RILQSSRATRSLNCSSHNQRMNSASLRSFIGRRDTCGFISFFFFLSFWDASWFRYSSIVALSLFYSGSSEKQGTFTPVALGFLRLRSCFSFLGSSCCSGLIGVPVKDFVKVGGSLSRMRRTARIE